MDDTVSSSLLGGPRFRVPLSRPGTRPRGVPTTSSLNHLRVHRPRHAPCLSSSVGSGVLQWLVLTILLRLEQHTWVKVQVGDVVGDGVPDVGRGLSSNSDVDLKITFSEGNPQDTDPGRQDPPEDLLHSEPGPSHHLCPVGCFPGSSLRDPPNPSPKSLESGPRRPPPLESLSPLKQGS